MWGTKKGLFTSLKSSSRSIGCRHTLQAREPDSRCQSRSQRAWTYACGVVRKESAQFIYSQRLVF
jgi:hypothetical protein